MKRGLLLFAAVEVSCAALAEGSGDVLVEQRSRSGWHLRVGPVMAPRVRVKISAPRFAAPPQRQVSSSATTSSSTTFGTGNGAAVPDPSSGYVARQYADGHVKPDEGTEDPDSFVYGLTWDWSADNVPAQYSGGRIEFHTDVARWSESVSRSVSGWEFISGGGGFDSRGDQDVLLGVEAMGGWTFFENKAFDAALDAGFRFYGSGDLQVGSGHEYGYGTSTTITKTRSEYRYVDSYDASGWSSVPAGSYTGTAGGPGRIIGAMPTRREESSGSTSSSESLESYSRDYLYGRSKLNYRIWDLRLGPTVGWKAMDWLTLRGGVYGLLGLVDAKLRADAATTIGPSSAKKSICDEVFGLAAGVSAQVNLPRGFFIMGGAEYDWWTDDVGLNAGSADAHIKLSDFTVSLALGVEF